MESTASEIYHALSRPWGKGEVKERKGPGGKMLSYVDARQVQNRLDEVVGTENWQTHFSEVCGNYCCTLSLKIDGEWVAKSDGAGETSIEGDKGGFSDAFKRAAVSFGIARYLYSDSKMTPENSISAVVLWLTFSQRTRPPSQRKQTRWWRMTLC